MLKGESILKLQDFIDQGKSLREIARETGFSRNTVRKYIRDSYVFAATVRTKRGSKLEKYYPQIDDWMNNGLYNCQVMLERLRNLGYTGGITILKDYVQPKRPPRKQKAVVCYETKPGEQAQIDWGICDYEDVNSTRRKIAVFVMVLGHSRSIYIEFTKRCDIYSFLKCFVHAIQHFGGIPKVALTDRMKTVILGTNDDHTPIWHPMLLDFALSIGLTPKVCKARKPQTKGKVERAVTGNSNPDTTYRLERKTSSLWGIAFTNVRLTLDA